MKQLSGLDAAFLAVESPTVFGHIGSVTLLDPAESGAQLGLDGLTRLIEARIHLMPPSGSGW